jgi:hypothetical protein
MTADDETAVEKSLNDTVDDELRLVEDIARAEAKKQHDGLTLHNRLRICFGVSSALLAGAAGALARWR